MHTKVLCILDGFGLAPESTFNAFSQETCPFIHSLFKNHLWLTLNADGDSVGQESGLVGNSEVGHMNLGGLQLVKQLSYQITQSATELYNNNYTDQIFDPKTLFDSLSDSTIHLIGLFSSGTIHSDLRHWLGAIRCANQANIKNIVLHLISDGRDTDRQSLVDTWKNFVNNNSNIFNTLEAKISLGSLGGRFYGMDRDMNLDRTKTHIEAIYEASPKEASLSDVDIVLKDITSNSYKKGIYDEHIKPLTTGKGISKNDVIWLINFRSDRMKQLTAAIVEQNKQSQLNNIIIANNCYDIGKETECPNIEKIATTRVLDAYYPIFKRKNVKNTFSDYCYKNNKTVLHIAETEKYAHVTYFFTGGRKEPRENETFKIIPTNKVRSHADAPEMKAKEITDYILEHGLGKADYVIVNFANPDMVGHTGDINAAKVSMSFLDKQIQRLAEATTNNNHAMILTADHGNVESVGQVTEEEFDTKHNPNPVPCVLISNALNSSILETQFNNILKENNIDFEHYPAISEKAIKAQSNRDSLETWFTEFDTDYPLWVAGVLLLSI